MNPVIQAIDAGHIHKGEKVAGICEKDGEQWPCAAIRAARSKHSRNLRKEKEG